MPSLSDTISRLSKMRAMAPQNLGSSSRGRLTELEAFGSNPGALRAWTYTPGQVAEQAPLVVVLHGCTQTADGYDVGAGWSELADRHGFRLLFPEQQRQNNPNLCFNWFSPDHNGRGRGEAASIHQMIAALVAGRDIDPARVFVTGLSAGGAMAGVMLAAYPEVFAGGAIIAGLPYACAATVPEAFDRMRGQGMPGDAELAKRVRAASPHAGPWPTLSIWHGSSDATVSPSNADAIIGQWRGIHGVGSRPSRIDLVDGYPRRVWCDESGREVIEAYSITGMGHGTPIDTAGPDGCGRSSAYMLETRISSTAHICRFWGLSAGADRVTQATAAPAARPRELVLADRPERGDAPNPRLTVEAPAAGVATGVGKVIEDALRAAGLMR